MLLKKFHDYAFCLVALLIPVGQPAVNVSIIVLAFAFLLNGRPQEKPDFKIRGLILIPVFFYALHLLGLFHSVNLKYGFLDIETKLSFLLFPLMFFIRPLELTKLNLAKLMFVLGCVSMCLYNIVNSSIQYHQTKSIDVFYYISFSKLMHVQYLTIYLNIAILIVMEYLFDGKAKKFSLAIGLFLILFFFVNISFLSSRLATIVCYITVALFMVLKTKQKQLVFKYWPYASLLVALVFFTDYFVLSHFNRFREVEIFFNTDQNFLEFDRKEYNSTNIRIPLWINAAQVIEKNKIFGVGTGDIKEELDSVYLKNKFAYAAEHHFSPHNQVFHTGVILGFTGIFMLLAMLLVPLYYSIRYKSYLLMCFIVIILINMMTESILERQAGIILFAFFYVVLITELYNQIRKSEELSA